MDKIPAEHFMGTIAVNVDNEKLSNADFREFIRNTLPIVQYPRKKVENRPFSEQAKYDM